MCRGDLVALCEKGEIERKYYSPSDSFEYYYKGQFYNSSLDSLRNPAEYDSSSEGYTPFGDE